MKKIMTVVGARPQFVKAAMTSRAILETDGLTEMIVHTGQHFDHEMSEVFFDELGISCPQYNLGIHGGGHGLMTAKMLEGVEKILSVENPDLVLVYGDTNSTLAAALAAAKMHTPIAHVEAGLRSYNKKMPEEINRVLTDHCSDLLLTPTRKATANLKKEGVDHSKIIQVGDVMYDVVKYFGNMLPIPNSRLPNFPKYILATLHRQENTDDPELLKKILESLDAIAQAIPVVLPLHPRTRKIIEENEWGEVFNHVTVIQPVGYLEMLQLERSASVIVTDSGGVQKEAFFHKVPCVTIRGETEWTELIDSGWNQLVNPKDTEMLAEEVLSAMDKLGKHVEPYGNGTASQTIAQAMVRFLYK